MYEYDVTYREGILPLSLSLFLNEKAKDGWRLVFVDKGYFYFERGIVEITVSKSDGITYVTMEPDPFGEKEGTFFPNTKE